MSDLFWLTEPQMARLEPYFPQSHDKPRVEDRRGLSGIIFLNRNGLRWRDAPADYGPHKTLYNRWKRWSEKGVFGRMMAGLAAEHGEEKTGDRCDLPPCPPDIDRHGRENGGRGRLIGRIKGGMNTKLHAICDSQSRPLDLFVTARRLLGVAHIARNAMGQRRHRRTGIAQRFGKRRLATWEPGR